MEEKCILISYQYGRIAFSLCSKLRESHAQERFLYDDIFTAHPDLVASSTTKDRKRLFGTEATTAWFDIYDMIAYVFDCGTVSIQTKQRFIYVITSRTSSSQNMA